MRHAFPVLLAFLPSLLFAQASRKAAACFWANDFETGIPLDWEITQVERQTPGGAGLGEFVPAFTLGTATVANSGGYFPVPDRPIGNQFIMANDDASPCNCDMSAVTLTTGPIDLTGRSGLALEFRAFHEMALGAGDAIVEASTNGSDWVTLDTLDAVAGAWQDIFLDLNAYDNAPLLKLRFRWSDGGTWSSGFALDDLCLRERTAVDLSVIDVQLHDLRANPFDGSADNLRYTMLPLEQARPLVISVVVKNRGLAAVTGIGANINVALDGTAQDSFSSGAVFDLAPGETDTLTLSSGWSAPSAGDVDVFATLSLSGSDDDTSDNTGADSMRITGPGWDLGYGAMACDDNELQGTLGSTQGFIAANRFEIVNAGSTARGASAVLGYDSQLGESVRAIIMDGNFAFIDTSLRHTITQADLDGAAGGLPLYLPFASPPSLDPGDYFVGLQRLAGTGHVSVATSGNCTAGTAAFMVGSTFDISWTEAIPMVRLHMNEYGVGVAETQGLEYPGLIVNPNPANGPFTLVWEQQRSEQVAVQLIDPVGRICQLVVQGHRSAGPQRIEMDASGLPSGAYLIRIATPSVTSCARLIVAR